MTNANTSACTIEFHQVDDWQTYRLSNSLISALAVPDVGGRVLEFQLADHQFFFVNESLRGRLFSAHENQGDGTIASWRNYGGSKTWPAPQGWSSPDEWAGPPDPVLDTGRYRVELATATADRAIVRMVSPPDSRTGITIARELAVERGTTQTTMRLEMRNISRRTVRWSLWDVVQLDCSQTSPTGVVEPRSGCRLYVPMNPASRHQRGYVVLFGPEDNPQWRHAEPNLVEVDYQATLGKIGIDSLRGWLAFTDAKGDHVFAARFTYEPGRDYPDRGSSVECWTQGPGIAAGVDWSRPGFLLYLLEAEILAPLVTLRPGESANTTIHWAATRCPAPIVDVSPAGCVSTPPSVVQRAGEAHLRGVFGVFQPCHLAALFRHRDGTALTTVDLGEASPLAPVRLDTAVAIPEAASGVDLLALHPDGTVWGKLGSCDLP